MRPRCFAAGCFWPSRKRGAQADGFFPLKKDAKWTYKVGDNVVEVRVTKVDKVGPEDFYTVDTVVGKDPKTSEVYVVRGDGVYRTKVKDDKLEPSIKVLELPVKKGATWAVNSKLGTQSIKGNMTVVNDKEKITVKTPTGDVAYDTVFVEGKDMDIAGAKTTVRVWFAKDRGIVKEEFTLQGGEKVVLELQSYTEGK